MSQINKEKIFDNLTNLYSISKTLRFELKPVGNTSKILEEDNVFQKDGKIQEKYEKIKPYFDKLHRDFLDFALQEASINFSSFIDLYLETKSQDKKSDEYKKTNDLLKDESEKIKSLLIKYFEDAGSKWAKKYDFLKKGNLDILFEKDVFKLLKERYGTLDDTYIKNEEDEEESIFDGFNSFTGYFSKFHETRKNLYKADISSSHSYRFIDQNLVRYCDNLIFSEKIKDILNLSSEEKEILNKNYYNKCLTQEGIDVYNKIIGGINSKINEFKQTGEKESKRIKLLKKLDKVILSEIEVEETGFNRENYLEKLDFFIKETQDRFQKGLIKVSDLLENPDKYNIQEIYINKKVFNTLLYKFIDSSVRFEFETNLSQRLGVKKDKDGNYKLSKNIKFIPLSEIRETFNSFDRERIILKDSLNNDDGWSLFLYKFLEEINNLYKEYSNTVRGVQDIVYLNIFPGSGTDKEKEAKAKVKDYLDSVKSLSSIMKYFAIEEKGIWSEDVQYDTNFYNEYKEDFYDDEGDSTNFIKFYNQSRNFLSMKEWSEDKWKLNFGNSYLAKGWDKNKETDNASIILRKGEKYYLGIMKSGNTNLFNDKNRGKFISSVVGDSFEKMVYKQIADPSKDIHNLVLLENGEVVRFTKMEKKKKYWPKEITRIKNSKSYAKENFNKDDFIFFVEYMKKCARGYWSDFSFQFKPTNTYNNIKDFTDDIQRNGYKITFERIPDDYVYKNNNDNKLFLFEICNKDKYERVSKKNLHTYYWNYIFSNENRDYNFLLKLNGEAELFFRPKSILDIKTETRGKVENIITKKRYTEDKIFFHVPITLNRVSKELNYSKSVNTKINNLIKENYKDISVIGIDRGEKNLLYYSLINSKQEIIAQGSLNEVNKISYYNLLYNTEKKRLEDRHSWEPARAIKNLKQGYVGHVVKELVSLMIKYNALIVFEDLNMPFKQKRSGVERSVYNQIEKALINKLQYLVFKEKGPSEIGGVLNGYQLVPNIKTEKDKGKQVGTILYTTAEYTSTTDPVTGFRKNIFISNSAKREDLINIFNKFESIAWDEEKQSYYFKYSLNEFFSDKKNDLRKFTVFANVPRVKRYKTKEGYWDHKYVNPNDLLKDLFSVWGFADLRGNIQEQIQEMEVEGLLFGQKDFDGKKRNFYSSLIYVFNLIMQIRNSFSKKQVLDRETNEIKEIGEDVDFISSPVEPFFCTNGGKYTEGYTNMAGLDNKFIGEDRNKFIESFNGDANGAYNIARKGLLMIERIRNNPEKPDLYISKSDWDNFTQN